MAVRTGMENTLDEAFSEGKEVEPVGEWDGDDHKESAQDKLNHHALVSQGQQIAIIQEQVLIVIDELGSLRKLCTSVRQDARKTNSMLEVLGKHLGVQLGTGTVVNGEPTE